MKNNPSTTIKGVKSQMIEFQKKKTIDKAHGDTSRDQKDQGMPWRKFCNLFIFLGWNHFMVV